ncbi:MAG: hypothetical protein Q8L90_02295 [Bacteroidota bacterium]|nr:hypothetical protein [Bacteroidota bacterium]
MKRILLDNFEITLELEDGIVIAKFKVQHFDLQTVQKLVADRKKVFNGILYPIIANVTSLKSSTKAARDFFASEAGCEGISAAAVIINSPVGSIIGNFYIRISKPLRPTKLFTDITEAKKWLEKFVKKE